MKPEHLMGTARDFIKHFSDVLKSEDLEHFAITLDDIATTVIQRGPLPRMSHMTLGHLSTLLPEVAHPAMFNAVENLDWGQLYDGGGIDAELAHGMFAAQAAGTYGVFPADQVATGLFLLAPHVHYPLHTHAAREVYHCLAGEIEITHGIEGTPILLRANQSSETPSGRLHTLRTGTKPALLAYVWTGDISAPTWWWAQDDTGQWLRTQWRRKPGETWKVIVTKPVDAKAMTNALKE